MKKLIFSLCLLTSVSAYADRLGSLRSASDVLLSSQTMKIYPATGTPNFQYGLSGSTGVFTGTVTAQGFYASTITTNNLYVGPSSAAVILPGVYNSISDPTGFLNRTSTLTFNDSDRTLTIVGDHIIYINGVAFKKPNGTSKQIANTTGMHYVYYDANGAIQESTSFPGFDLPLVSSIYWNATSSQGAAGDERHGIKMDADTHMFLHDTIGCRYESGLTATAYNSSMTVTSGYIHDEDIDFLIPAQSTFSVFYKNGSADYEWVGSTTVYYLMNGANLRYNNGNALADVASNSYMAVWVFATTSISTPVVSVIGQRTDITLANARANNTYESLVLGSLPFKEMKLIYRIILRNTGIPPTYTESADYRSVSGVPGGAFVATAHSVLTGLNWSSAGHSFDQDLALGTYGLTGSSATVTFVSASSSITTPAANISTIATTTQIKWADGTIQVSSPVASSGGGVSVYPATSTILGSEPASLASVSYGFNGDPNTGLLRPNTDILQIITAGAIASSITAAGEIIQPLQPSVLVTDGTGAADVTGDNTAYTLLWPTEIYDQGGDFASNTFTAPVSARYLISAHTLLRGITANHAYIQLVVNASNRYFRFMNHANGLAWNQFPVEVNCIMDMDANDTVYTYIQVSNSTKVVDVNDGDASGNFMSITLIN